MRDINYSQESKKGQKEIWVSQQIIEDSSIYNTAEIIDILGKVDRKKFTSSVVTIFSNVKHSNAGFYKHKEIFSPPYYQNIFWHKINYFNMGLKLTMENLSN